MRFLPVRALININLKRHFELPDPFHYIFNKPGNFSELIRRHFQKYIPPDID